MKEIDLRSLLYNHLKCEKAVYSLETINEKIKNNEFIYRNFNNEYIWKPKKATYYIESVMLNIECQSIVLFNYHGYFYICDGLNRIITLNNFINNKLKLSKEGLSYFTDLTNKRFRNLDENYQEKFLNNIFFQFKIYTYIDENKKNLDDLEINEIIKYLYHLYNNCTKLELVDYQRAEYCDEEISRLLKIELKKNASLVKKIETVFFTNIKVKDNNIDNKLEKLLIYIRNCLCLTYNSVGDISKCSGTKSRIEKLFLKGIKRYDSKKIITDFNICIDILYNLTTNTIWKKSENIQNKYFIEMLYWLISNIKRDNLCNVSNIPLEEIMKYFNQEEYKELFNSQKAFNKEHLLMRIEAMTKYAEDYLGISINNCLENDSITGEKKAIPSQEYSFYPIQSISVSVKDIIKDSQKGMYDFFPEIQRGEVIKLSIASEIIQSIILGIELPPILIYEENINDKIVRTIIDGKQRLLSIIGFLGEYFFDINNEKKYSTKNNFHLQNLKILSELNGKGFNEKNSDKILNEKYRKIIKDYNLDIIIINKDKILDFNKKEHFLRINGSFQKKKSFDNWVSISDTIVMNEIINISKKHKNKLFSKNENSFFDIILRLSYLEYKYTFDNENKIRSKVSPNDVNIWLEHLEKIKRENSLLDPEKIQPEREKYLKAINIADLKITTIENWLEKNNDKIENVFCLKNKNSRQRDYICLYELIGNISIEALNSKYEEITINLKEFYTKIRELMKEKNIIELLTYYKDKIDILDETKRRNKNILVNKML